MAMLEEWLELRGIKVKRTKKEFKEYNEYKDRVFGLKWGTAFAMADLMKKVKSNEEYALKDNLALQQIDRKEIDIKLAESLLQTKEIELQLNLLDEFGRIEDSVVGFFKGEAYEDYFVFGGRKICWEDVRHIKFTDEKKWFDVNIFNEQNQQLQRKNKDTDELQIIRDEYYQDFYSDEI